MDTNPTNNPLDVVKGREQEIGPIFGIAIILILLIIGTLYFLNHERQIRSESPSPTATTTEIVIYRNIKIGTSTEPVSSIGDSQAARTEQSSNAELNALEANLENQTQGINNLNF